MVELDNVIWSQLEGGYRILYNASIPLKQLETSTDADAWDTILDELFEALYHQGDVGLASYLSIPHLIRIGLANRITSWKLIGLITSIEIARHNKHNPKIPGDYSEEYHDSLQKVNELISIQKDWDRTYTCCALSLLAASKGKIDIAAIILEMESEDLSAKFHEFMENY